MTAETLLAIMAMVISVLFFLLSLVISLVIASKTTKDLREISTAVAVIDKFSDRMIGDLFSFSKDQVKAVQGFYEKIVTAQMGEDKTSKPEYQEAIRETSAVAAALSTSGGVWRGGGGLGSASGVVGGVTKSMDKGYSPLVYHKDGNEEK